MADKKKHILIFGANSFIARSFIRLYSDHYFIHPVYRNRFEETHNLDFENPTDLKGFAETINFKADAVLFLQGINPSMSATEITEDHFLRMMKVNLVTPVLVLSALSQKLSDNGLVLFMSSVAKRKGSYDPSYAAAKSALGGLIQSLANSYPRQRFNMISLGLVEGSPVYTQMTEDFRAKHASKMQNGEFIKAENVSSTIDMLIQNGNINRADIPLDGGYN